VNSPATYHKHLESLVNVSTRLAKARSEATGTLSASSTSGQNINRSGEFATVRVVVKDLFEELGDVVVIPCSAQGTITQRLEQKLDEFDAPSPPMMPHGDVRLVPTAALPDGVRALAYAASVSGNSSDIKAIQNIGVKLGRLTQENGRIRKVAAPLLGTGAGNLKPALAYRALKQGFRQTASPGAVLVICVLDDKTARELSNE
jgi:hypothetical protein